MKKDSLVKKILFTNILTFIVLISGCSKKLSIPDFADYNDPFDIVEKSTYIFVAKIDKKIGVETKGVGIYFKYSFTNPTYILNKTSYNNSILEIISDTNSDIFSANIVGCYSLFIGAQFSEEDMTPKIYIYETLETFDNSLSLLEQNNSVKEHYLKYIEIIEND
ncbi:MAG: hypothetical protein LBM99_02385 [Bacillales bacterium]|jgi:hypothetical protein|nr:hypothetical protein [Bacillales bacterium]